MFGPDVAYFLDAARSLAPLLRRLGLAGDVEMLGTATVDPCPPSLQFPDSIAPTRRIRVRHTPYPGLAEVPSWLPDRPARPRICLSWGTTIEWFVGDRAFLPTEVLLGCAKLADERDAELVLAITANQRPLLPADLPPNIRVVESAPLDALLSTCQAFIHHGGGATTLTAARCGLPQLVLPPMYDQAATAVLLTAAGVGLTIAAAGVTTSELLATGHDLLDDPGYRAAAGRLRQEILDQPTPAEIVADLVALA
jgi:UDP:flavonoid glycosyltransferase YjiC (YdhE family)